MPNILEENPILGLTFDKLLYAIRYGDEMFSFYFVNCMMTISAVSFLSNFNTKPLSLLINQFQEQMQLGASALIVLVILIVNLLLKFVLGKICSK